MSAWGNFWAKGHSTTFGPYYKDGYTSGYIANWWSTALDAHSNKDLRILEVGCGNASLVPCMLDLGVKGSYVGVDAAEISISDAVKKRINDNLNIVLRGNTGIEDFQSQHQFDLIGSVYGLEYSPLDQSLPKLRELLTTGGEINLLMHHSGSVITEMSVKAIEEFDFKQMETVIDKLTSIDHELRASTLAGLQHSQIAQTSREDVNQFISSVMHIEAERRNPIMVDFCQAVLTFFKKLKLPEQERRAYLESILEDFHSSKERFRQMVDVARDEDEIKQFEIQLKNAGFNDIITRILNKDGAPVAWNIKAH